MSARGRATSHRYVNQNDWGRIVGMRLLAPPSLLLFSILSYGVSSLLAQEPDTTPRFRAEVDQVVLYVSVYDRDGNLVTDLKQEEFTIYEDKVEQEITSFAQAEVPSSIGIVYDSSGSMRNKRSEEHTSELQSREKLVCRLL